MDRLLAHPPSLPLRHVDHSHRLAPPAVTGKCLGVHNANPITAQFGVRVMYAPKMTRTLRNLDFTKDYKLDQLECPQPGTFAAGTPTMPRLSAVHVRNYVVDLASDALGNANAIANISLAEEEGGAQTYLGAVQKAGGETIGTLPEDAIDNIKHVLTAYFNAPNGPVFYIACEMRKA
jgi:hypothetical protein